MALGRQGERQVIISAPWYNRVAPAPAAKTRRPVFRHPPPAEAGVRRTHPLSAANWAP